MKMIETRRSHPRTCLAAILALAMALALSWSAAPAHATEGNEPPAEGAASGSVSAQDTEDSEDTLSELGNDRLWAGETLYLSGERVPNDLLVAGRILHVTDCRVGGSIRAAGQDVEIVDTAAHESVTVAAQTIQIKEIEAGTVVLFGSEATFAGTCSELSIVASKVFIDGTVKGDVHVDGTDVVVGNNADIEGTLYVEAENPPTIDEAAAVKGVEYVRSGSSSGGVEPPSSLPSAMATIGLLLSIAGLISTMVSAFVAEWLFGRHTRAAAQMVRTSPAAQLGGGAIAILVFPIAVVLMTLLLVTIPLALCVVLAYIMIGMTCQGFAGASLAKLAFPRLGRYTGALAGGAAITLVGLLPLIGFLVRLGAFIYLLGYVIQSICLSMRDNGRPVSDAWETPGYGRPTPPTVQSAD